MSLAVCFLQTMLFADNIVLVDLTRSGVNAKLEIWWDSLESKGFQLRKTQPEYVECYFSQIRNRDVVKLDGQGILRSWENQIG